MTRSTLAVALFHQTFDGPNGGTDLVGLLKQAALAGAEIALLPELPLDPWVPANREPRAQDAEEPGQRRHRQLGDAARESGIAVLGGVIVRDPKRGRRYNRALLFDRTGRLVATYDKLHIPSEEGFWESDHYDEGETPPGRIDLIDWHLGIQICSDLQRPQGCQLLGAQGVEAVLAPRATPLASYERWRTIIRANAITSATYVLSANRPRFESGAPIGGPTLAVAPDGEVVLESTDPFGVVRLHREAVARARRDYPGYLPLRAELYGKAWTAVSRRQRGVDPRVDR